MVAKVLELQQAVWPPRSQGLDELVQERVVLHSHWPPPPQALVLWVLQKGLTVRADVQADGEALVRRHPRRRGVQLDLSLADSHAARAQVAQTEDALPVRHNDGPDLVAVLPGPQLLQHAPPVLQGDVEPRRLDIQVRVLLARLTHRGRVNIRQNLLRALHQQSAVGPGVPGVQASQREVLVEVSLGAAKDLVDLVRHHDAR
mmetsp:Transcript_5014/g.17614  ORF Transcript_5014/g.17614 Transcript_5014/m.17614 type:complete len:202 (-) Transcript_5014:608-1213(-)